MNNKSSNTFWGYLEHTVLEAIQKRKLQQQAAQKNEALRQANIMKACLKPHIESIFKENIHLQKCGRVAIPECYYDPTRQMWKLRVQTICKEPIDALSPRLLISLNDSKAVYYEELRLKYIEEQQDLEMRANAANANLVNIQLAMNQLLRKYEILNHQLMFTYTNNGSESDRDSIVVGMEFK